MGSLKTVFRGARYYLPPSLLCSCNESAPRAREKNKPSPISVILIKALMPLVDVRVAQGPLVVHVTCGISMQRHLRGRNGVLS